MSGLRRAIPQMRAIAASPTAVPIHTGLRPTNSRNSSSAAANFGFGVLAVFVALTATCAIWAWLTPGDWFANGSAMVIRSSAAAAAFALWLSLRRNSRAFRACLILSALLALTYWLFLPSDWWATPPPGSPR